MYIYNENYACDYNASGCACMTNFCFNFDYTVCSFGGYGVPCQFIPAGLIVAPPIVTPVLNYTSCYLYNNI